jgi:prepilin-type N-terminal cleavage/methylation domain-containing protein
MPQSRQERAAFTLVELLAVLVVLGILAGMVTAALASVKESARASKTRGIIAAIDEVLQAKWEEYRVRPFSVVVPNPFTADPTISPELRPVESARVRLLMVRDLMRMELPDRQSDILTDPQFVASEIELERGVILRADFPGRGGHLDREIQHRPLARADIGLAIIRGQLIGNQRILFANTQDRAVRDHAILALIDA